MKAEVGGFVTKSQPKGKGSYRSLFWMVPGILMVALSGCSHFMSTPEPLKESVLKLPEANDRWWSAFHDPIMEALAQKLMDQNLDIKVARARLDEARGVSRTSSSALFPQVSGRTSVDRGNQQLNALQPYWVASTGLSASWEVDLFGRQRSSIRAADAVVLSRLYSLHYTGQLMLAELFQAVVSWRQAETLLAETQKLLKAQEDQVQLFRSRTDAGLLDASYVERAEAQRAQTATQLHLARAGLMQAQYAMECLIGQEPGTLTDLLAQAQGALRLPDLPSMGHALALDLDILKHRPDIEAARQDVLAAEANIATAEAGLWPTITIGAFFGRQITSSGLKSAGPTVWDVMPSLQMPLLDFGRVRGSIDGAKAQACQAWATYERVVLKALQEAYTALSDYHHGLDAVAQQEAALTYRKTTVALAEDRFQHGVTDMIDLTTAQAELDQATITWIQRKADAAIAYIRLNKALGLSLPPLPSHPSHKKT